MTARFAVAGIDLGLVARSHGWFDLPPFAWDEERRRLSFVFLRGASAVSVAIAARDGGVAVTSPGPASAVRPVVARVLDLGSDLAPFHELCAARRGEGISRRAPTDYHAKLRESAPEKKAHGGFRTHSTFGKAKGKPAN